MGETHDVKPALPPQSGMRHLAWGLAGFALALVVTLFAGGVLSAGIEALRGNGIIRPAAPPSNLQERFRIPIEVYALVAVVAIFSPFVLSGVVAAMRCRWWIGIAVGLAIGVIFAGLALAAGVDQWEVLVFLPLWWLPGGLTGAGLSAIRRWRGV